MSNSIPNEQTNAQPDPSANASQTSSQSTSPAGVVKRPRLEKQYVLGAAAVLVLCGLLIWHFLSQEKMPSVVYDPSEPETIEAPQYIEPPAFVQKTLVVQQVSNKTPAKDKAGADDKTGAKGSDDSAASATAKDSSSNFHEENVPTIYDFDPNPDVRCDEAGNPIDYSKNPNKNRIVADDTAVLAKFDGYCGTIRGVFAGLQLLDACGGDFELPNDKDSSMSNLKYHLTHKVVNYGIYVMPECIIDENEKDVKDPKSNREGFLKQSYYEQLNELTKRCNELGEEKSKTTQGEFRFRIHLINDTIKEKAAAAINKKYMMKDVVTKDNIEVMPVEVVRVYLDRKQLGEFECKEYESEFGEISSIDIVIKDSVYNLRCGLVNNNFKMKVMYAISGHTYQRNYQGQSIYGMMSTEIMHDLYTKEGVNLKTVQAEFEIGKKNSASVTINKIVNIASSKGAGLKAEKIDHSASFWIEERDLVSLYQLVFYRVSNYRRFETDTNIAPFEAPMPRWSDFFGQPVSVTFQDGQLKSDNKELQEFLPTYQRFIDPNNELSGLKVIPQDSNAGSGGIVSVALNKQLGFGYGKKTVNISKDLKFYKVVRSQQVVDAIRKDIEIKSTFFSRWVPAKAVTVKYRRHAEYEQKFAEISNFTRVYSPISLESANNAHAAGFVCNPDITVAPDAVANRDKGWKWSLGNKSSFMVRLTPTQSTDGRILLNLNCEILGTGNSKVTYVLHNAVIASDPIPGVFHVGTLAKQHDQFLNEDYDVPVGCGEWKRSCELSNYNHAKRGNPSELYDGDTTHDGSCQDIDPVTFPQQYNFEKRKLSFWERLFVEHETVSVKINNPETCPYIKGNGYIEVEGEHVIHYTTSSGWGPWEDTDYRRACITKDCVSLSLNHIDTFVVPYVIETKPAEDVYEEFSYDSNHVTFE